MYTHTKINIILDVQVGKLYIFNMETSGEERLHFLRKEHATQLFATQLQIDSELLEEVHILSGGRPGLINAIIARVADANSYEPEAVTTPGRARSIIGAPEDYEQLDEWREGFVQQLTKEATAT